MGVSEGDDLFEFVAERLDPLPVLLLLTPFFVDVELDPFVLTCSSLIASLLDDFELVGLVLAMTNRDDVELVPLEDEADIVPVDVELVSVSLVSLGSAEKLSYSSPAPSNGLASSAS